MIRPRLIAATALLVATVGMLGGCGGGDEQSVGGGLPLVKSAPAPPASDFPKAHGQSIRELLKSTTGPSGFASAPLAKVFEAGVNRYPFLLLTPKMQRQNTDAQVALYIARIPQKPVAAPGSEAANIGVTGPTGPSGKAPPNAVDQPAHGPYPAGIVSLATKPQFRSDTTRQSGNPARAFYVTDIDFPSRGKWLIAAVFKTDDGLTGSLMGGATVEGPGRVPQVGERAPLIHTPTPATVNGDLSKLTTRVPPEKMNRVDFAKALGRKPIVLLFSSPKFCQSKLCIPAVDLAEQVSQRYGNNVAFIHMDIFKDNRPADGVRPQVRRYHLPTEPWAFIIGEDGMIKKVFEGPFSTDELKSAIDKGITK